MRKTPNSRTLNFKDYEKMTDIYAYILTDQNFIYSLSKNKIKVGRLNFTKNTAWFNLYDNTKSQADILVKVEFSGATNDRYKGVDILGYNFNNSEDFYSKVETKLTDFNLVQIEYIIAPIESIINKTINFINEQRAKNQQEVKA